MQSIKFILSQNEVHKDVPESELRIIDRQELVQLMICFGLEPVRVEADDRQVQVLFFAKDTEKFENSYLSNKDLVVPFQRIVYANDYWRNLIVLWKSKLQFNKLVI
jgi:hypothetical protein